MWTSQKHPSEIHTVSSVAPHLWFRLALILRLSSVIWFFNSFTSRPVEKYICLYYIHRLVCGLWPLFPHVTADLGVTVNSGKQMRARKARHEPDTVVYTYNPITQKAETGLLRVQSESGLQSEF